MTTHERRTEELERTAELDHARALDRAAELDRADELDRARALERDLPEDLYSDRARGCSASMPLLSDYVPLAALHLAGQAFELHVIRLCPRLPDGSLDIPSDLDLRSCGSYFDLRVRAVRRKCLACGAEQAQYVTERILADWSPAIENKARFARVYFDYLVEFHRAHDACRARSLRAERGGEG